MSPQEILLSYTGSHQMRNTGVLHMRTLRYLVLSAVCLLYCPKPIPAQTAHEPTDLDHRFARHFPEKPPLQFEMEENAERAPRIIISNSYQFPLTAYVVQTEPRSANDTAQTLTCDALTRIGLLAPIPRGLSHLMGVPHVVGGVVPDAKLVAAVWEDGSTFGPDELLSRISSSRSAMADSYDLAIVALQTGLEKNWSVQEYLAAAQQLKPPMPLQPPAAVEEAMAISQKHIAANLPGHTITVNMQHAVQSGRSPARVAKLAQILVKDFEQSRDSLRGALGGSAASADQTKN
jgi:hypothetical protein